MPLLAVRRASGSCKSSCATHAHAKYLHHASQLFAALHISSSQLVSSACPWPIRRLSPGIRLMSSAMQSSAGLGLGYPAITCDGCQKSSAASSSQLARIPRTWGMLAYYLRAGELTRAASSTIRAGNIQRLPQISQRPKCEDIANIQISSISATRKAVCSPRSRQHYMACWLTFWNPCWH